MDQNGNAIAKPSYTHKAMVDLIMEYPMISQGDIARHFGYTQGWVSRMLSSDCMQEMLADRRKDFINPAIAATMEERLRGLAHISMEVLQEKLELPTPSADIAIKVLDLSSRALGYGAKDRATVNIEKFIAYMPMKSENAEHWIEGHKPGPGLAPGDSLSANVIDVE